MPRVDLNGPRPRALTPRATALILLAPRSALRPSIFMFRHLSASSVSALSQSASLAIFSALLLAPTASADRIYLSDGSILEKVDVVSESLTEVVYKAASSAKEETVAADRVLDIEFEQMPKTMATAEIDAKAKRFGAAISGMQDYLANIGGKKDKDHPWAKAYAMYRIAELNKLGGDLEGMVAAIDALKTKMAESRYVPVAMLDHIDTLISINDSNGAKEAISAFSAAIKTSNLPQRWEYEADARRLMTDSSLKGESLESKLGELAKKAAAYSSVNALAEVKRAESLIARDNFESATEVLRDVTENPKATGATMAAAWTALGEALYEQAQLTSATDAQEERTNLLEEAQLAFMRVVVNHEFEYGYVAKAAYYAGRTFQELKPEGWRDSARDLFNYVRRNFRDSDWAQQAAKANRQN